MRALRILVTVGLSGLFALPATAQTTHTCFGEVADTVGTSGDDELRGDVVVGLGGEDRIVGRLVCAGKGDDQGLFAAESVNAGPGNDHFIEGAPLAIGGSGGDDFFDRGLPKEVRRGGEGDDTWIPEGSQGGDPELDIFNGGAGNDATNSEEGFFYQDTRQFGGPGNDYLEAGGGKDKLFGGDDDDVLTLERTGSEPAGISDLFDGGDGFDTCLIQAEDRAINCEDVTVVS
jgi:Ca2+-binding RTX toxin-like protein